MSDVVEDEDEDGSSPLLAVAFLSRSATVACSSSKSRRAACTRRRAAAALASMASASLTRASSRYRRASVSGSEGMVEKKRRRPHGDAAARVWVLQLCLSLSLEYGKGDGQEMVGGSPKGQRPEECGSP
jgi:hypothetical protein